MSILDLGVMFSKPLGIVGIDLWLFGDARDAYVGLLEREAIDSVAEKRE